MVVLNRVAALLLAVLPVEAQALEAGTYDDPTLPATLMIIPARTGPDRLFENVRISKPGCLGGWTIVFRYSLPKTYKGGPVDAQSATGSGVIDCGGATTRLVGVGADRYSASFACPAPKQIVQNMATGWGGTFLRRSSALVGIVGRSGPFTDAQLGLTIRVVTNRPRRSGGAQTMSLRDFMRP